MSTKFREDKANKKVMVQIDQLEERTARGIRKGFFRLGADLRNTLRKDMLTKDKTGKVYIRRDRAGRRRRHVSSGDGQTPANMTGTYRKHIGFQIRGSKTMEFGVREPVKYAIWLEDSTPNMAARPGLGNTVKKRSKNADMYFSRAIERELKRA